MVAAVIQTAEAAVVGHPGEAIETIFERSVAAGGGDGDLPVVGTAARGRGLLHGHDLRAHGAANGDGTGIHRSGLAGVAHQYAVGAGRAVGEYIAHLVASAAVNAELQRVAHAGESIYGHGTVGLVTVSGVHSGNSVYEGAGVIGQYDGLGRLGAAAAGVAHARTVGARRQAGEVVAKHPVGAVDGVFERTRATGGLDEDAAVIVATVGLIDLHIGERRRGGFGEHHGTVGRTGRLAAAVGGLHHHIVSARANTGKLIAVLESPPSIDAVLESAVIVGRLHGNEAVGRTAIAGILAEYARDDRLITGEHNGSADIFAGAVGVAHGGRVHTGGQADEGTGRPVGHAAIDAELGVVPPGDVDGDGAVIGITTGGIGKIDASQYRLVGCGEYDGGAANGTGTIEVAHHQIVSSRREIAEGVVILKCIAPVDAVFVVFGHIALAQI